MVEAPSFKHHGPSNKQQTPSRKPHNLWLNCGKIVAQPEVVFFFSIYPAPTPTACQV